MKPIYPYQFEVNALYAKNHLLEYNIKTSVKEINVNDKIIFIVMADEKVADKAFSLLQELDLDESELDPESKNYLDDHYEWTHEMYSPGHYTGGKVPHWLTSDGNKKLLWVYYIVIPVIGFTLFSFNKHRHLNLLLLLVLVIVLFVSITKR